MKILCFSDLHLQLAPKFGWEDSATLPKRLKEQEDILNQIWETVKSKHIDTVIF